MAEGDFSWGWATGLFEGEGCIAYTKKSDSWALYLVSTDQDVVARFYEVVGVGNVHGYAPRGSNHKPTWRWATGARKDVLFVLKKMLPLLCDRRRARANQAIASIQARITGKHRSELCKNGHPRVATARRCAICAKIQGRNWYLRKKASA